MLKRLRAYFLRQSPYRISVIIGVLFLLLLIVSGGKLNQWPVVGPVENIFHDLKFKVRGARKVTGDVVIAAADEKANSTPGLGRWPYPRESMATVVDKITRLGAKAISFDIAYVDAVSEGQNASARRLKQEFDGMSFAGAGGNELLDKVKAAQMAVAGVTSAVDSLPAGNTAARDAKDRVEPLAQNLNAAFDTLKKFQSLDTDFGAELAKESGGASGDELFAKAVHQSGRVVLGSLLLVPKDADQLTQEKKDHELSLIQHVRIPFPTVEPSHLGPDDELVNEGKPVYGVHFHNFKAAHAAYDALIQKSADGPAPQIAFYNTKEDRDSVIRREPLVLSVGDPYEPDKLLLVPNIDLGGILKFYDADPGETRLWTTSADPSQFEYVAVLPGSAKGTHGPPKMKDFKRIPVDSDGTFLVNYYGPDGTFDNISIGDIWNNTVPRSKIEGKIVIIGVTAPGTFDERTTPFNSFSPGVEIHANAMENILHDDYLRRPWWAFFVESAILLFISLVVGRFLSRVRPTTGAFVSILVAGGYLLFDYGLFLNGIAVFNAIPVAEVFFIFVAQTIQRYVIEEQGKNQIRNAFQLYLQPSVIDEMLKKQELPKLGGEKKVLSVMFSDIRGFTTISEKLTPEQLAKLINEYLTPMTSLVFEHGGTLDKYIGDALMAIFGAPVEQPDHALRCCRTAVHMMRELAKLQERWRMEGNNYPPIDIGIGINSGPMVVGNMGGNQRFDYTVLGDNVNLASRLEGTNKEYRSHIIISEATFSMCDGQIAARELGAVRVKGKREPVKIYELMDDKPASGEQAEVIALFNQGIAMFRTQKWQDGIAQFQKVLAIWPHDGPAAAYIEFCKDYEKAPPDADWDGVYTMLHK